MPKPKDRPLFTVTQRVTPSCKRADCDIEENPEHWVTVEPSEHLKKKLTLLESSIDLADAIVKRYGEDILKDEPLEGAEVVDFLTQYLFPLAAKIIDTENEIKGA